MTWHVFQVNLLFQIENATNGCFCCCCCHSSFQNISFDIHFEKCRYWFEYVHNYWINLFKVVASFPSSLICSFICCYSNNISCAVTWFCLHMYKLTQYPEERTLFFYGSLVFFLFSHVSLFWKCTWRWANRIAYMPCRL